MLASITAATGEVLMSVREVYRASGPLDRCDETLELFRSLGVEVKAKDRDRAKGTFWVTGERIREWRPPASPSAGSSGATTSP